MAVRSFQQILDAHEAAQSMLRSLEVDVRDTLNQARVELAKSQVAPAPPAVAVAEWKVGDRFAIARPPHQDRYIPRDVSFDRIYTVIAAAPWRSLPQYKLAFIDDKGRERMFYDFWGKLIRKV